MLNKVILMGRLCADPELKQTPNGAYFCRIRLAVNRPYRKDAEQQTDFISVICWGKTAEFAAQYFTKGKLMIAEGALHNNDYTDQNGVKHYAMEVQASNVMFGESKSASQAPPQQNQPIFPPQGVSLPQNTPFPVPDFVPADRLPGGAQAIAPAVQARLNAQDFSDGNLFSDLIL